MLEISCFFLFSWRNERERWGMSRESEERGKEAHNETEKKSEMKDQT